MGVNSVNIPVDGMVDTASIVDAGVDQTVCAADTIYLHVVFKRKSHDYSLERMWLLGSWVGSDIDPNAKFVLNSKW